MNVNGTTAGTVDLASKTFDNDEGNNIYTIPASGNLKKEVTIKVHEEGDMHYMSFSHELVNTMTKDADYTEYEFEIHIQHRDNDTYDETIKITQYPMIPIKAEQNSDYTNDNSTNGNHGFVYVNGGGSYGGNNGITSNAGNKNPNRYIISATALDISSDFIIGDPRTLTSNLTLLGWNNTNSNSSRQAPTMKYQGDTNNRRLLYYHPTEEANRTKTMISPQFMIASSYGVTSGQGRDDARRRCATYVISCSYPDGVLFLNCLAKVALIGVHTEEFK